jgi:hypothetical protein
MFICIQASLISVYKVTSPERINDRLQKRDLPQGQNLLVNFIIVMLIEEFMIYKLLYQIITV